jgi:hypothetical protein
MQCGDPNNPGGPGIRANGHPCSKPVVPGTFRCELHGGKAPIAKFKAEQALALLRFPAIEVLNTAMERLNEIVIQSGLPSCAACGFPVKTTEELEAVVKACISAAKVCQTVLDRTGMGPTSKVEVVQSDGTLDLNLLTEEELGIMTALFAQYDALKEEIRQRLFNTPSLTQKVRTEQLLQDDVTRPHI